MNLDLQRESLNQNLLLLQIFCSLNNEPKENFSNSVIKNLLNKYYDEINLTTDEVFIRKKDSLRKEINTYLNPYLKAFKLKKEPKAIINDFFSFYDNINELYSFGVEFGWLNDCFDLSSFSLPKNLPYHSKIGIGQHAGSANVEEQNLLSDAFFMLVKFQFTHNILLKFGEQIISQSQNKKINIDLYKKLTEYKFCIISYARLCIISFYSFVESFINSVGYDFFKRNTGNLGEEEAAQLLGKRNNRYLSLEKKIEIFPSIIRNDKKKIFSISDTNQCDEPFKTFFSEYKQLRDSSVHYSPIKQKIVIRLDEWNNKVNDISFKAIEVSQLFWQACYPHINSPGYLLDLNYNKHLEIAKNRLKIEEEIIEEFS